VEKILKKAHRSISVFSLDNSKTTSSIVPIVIEPLYDIHYSSMMKT
jgi:hypothetical protein